MNNFFLVQLFDWGSRDQGKWMRRTQALFRQLGLPWLLRRALDPTCDMTSFEVRQNLWHFATQTLAYAVPGDFAAFGCFDGKTAVIYQKVLDDFGSPRRLHLYDHFQTGLHLGEADVRAELEKNFREAGVRSPVIHEGDFHATIPAALPAEIACMDIDCGTGGDPLLHEATVLYLLEHVYPRMAPGAIGVLMDFHEPGVTTCPDYNPGVGRACRKFFAGKPETVHSLWAGEYPQGYFRKRP
jgi:O-methyltransferase